MTKHSLPLLDYTDELFPEVDLSECLFICCQHILWNKIFFFESLFRKGLKPENTFLLGKCYSTNSETLKKFQEMGIHVHPASFAYDSYRSFDEQFEKHIIDFLNETKGKVKLSSYEKVILLDDGSYLLRYANTVLKDFDNVVSVEQTSSGYSRLRTLQLNFPVLNVARSNAKLKVESPFIAEDGLEELWFSIKRRQFMSKKVLIVGFGAIGSAVYKILKDKFQVKCYDLNEKLSDFQGVELRDIVSDYDLIIGCTGNTVLKSEEFGLLKNGVVLASMSSSDREFDSVGLRRLVPRNNDCHKDITANGIKLINSGFPVNFDGSKIVVPLEKIQLTDSLMLSAALLASKNNYMKGLVTFDNAIQKAIVSEFKKLVPV